MADLENFGGGGILSTKPQKFRMSWPTEIESDFLAEIGNSNVFFAQNQVVAIARFAASINCTIVSQLQRTNQICPFFLSL